MANSGITTALIFVCMVTLLLGLSQAAINDLSSNQGTQFNGCGKVFQKAYNTQQFNSSTNLNTDQLKDLLPGSATTAPSATNGFFVVDWIGAAASWLGKQIDTVTEIVSGPYCALHSIPSIPTELVTLISALWYTICILLLAAFIFGR